MSAQAARARAADEVRVTLERVLERAEFASDEPDALERALERLLELLGGLDVDPSAAWVLVWASVVLLALLTAWLLVRAFSAGARSRAPLAPAHDARPAPADVEARLAELRARAAAARAEGDLTLALRLSFFALLVALSRRGDLELREAWTPREMLERGSPGAGVRAALEPCLQELDARLFGTQGVGADDLRRFDALFEGLLARGGGGRP